ncbi:hypothetical protein FACS189494_02310 [Spirochaetia bacterium]|nr:hypothetical protein FACS189494_02310 [Spirochaetia bacterium]
MEPFSVIRLYHKSRKNAFDANTGAWFTNRDRGSGLLFLVRTSATLFSSRAQFTDGSPYRECKGKSGDVRDKTGGAPWAPVLITDKRRAFVFGDNRRKDGCP